MMNFISYHWIVPSFVTILVVWVTSAYVFYRRRFKKSDPVENVLGEEVIPPPPQVDATLLLAQESTQPHLGANERPQGKLRKVFGWVMGLTFLPIRIPFSWLGWLAKREFLHKRISFSWVSWLARHAFSAVKKPFAWFGWVKDLVLLAAIAFVTLVLASIYAFHCFMTKMLVGGTTEGKQLSNERIMTAPQDIDSVINGIKSNVWILLIITACLYLGYRYALNNRKPLERFLFVATGIAVLICIVQNQSWILVVIAAAMIYLTVRLVSYIWNTIAGKDSDQTGANGNGPTVASAPAETRTVRREDPPSKSKVSYTSMIQNTFWVLVGLAVIGLFVERGVRGLNETFPAKANITTTVPVQVPITEADRSTEKLPPGGLISLEHGQTTEAYKYINSKGQELAWHIIEGDVLILNQDGQSWIDKVGNMLPHFDSSNKNLRFAFTYDLQNPEAKLKKTIIRIYYRNIY